MTRPLAFLAVLFLAGCTGKREVATPVSADKGTPSIDVPELLKHHERFRGKEVELRGFASRYNKNELRFYCAVHPSSLEFRQVATARFSDDEAGKITGFPKWDDRFLHCGRETIIRCTVEYENIIGQVRLSTCRFIKVFPND